MSEISDDIEFIKTSHDEHVPRANGDSLTHAEIPNEFKAEYKEELATSSPNAIEAEEVQLITTSPNKNMANKKIKSKAKPKTK